MRVRRAISYACLYVLLLVPGASRAAIEGAPPAHAGAGMLLMALLLLGLLHRMRPQVSEPARKRGIDHVE